MLKKATNFQMKLHLKNFNLLKLQTIYLHDIQNQNLFPFPLLGNCIFFNINIPFVVNIGLGYCRAREVQSNHKCILSRSSWCHGYI